MGVGADSRPPTADPADLVAKFVNDTLAAEAEKKPRRPKKKLKDAVKAPPPRPSLEAFLDHVFVEFGGQVAVAKALVAEFRAAPPGSQLRSRLLELVLRSMKSADATNKPLDNLDVLTDADIERELDKRDLQLFGARDEHAAGPGNPVPPEGETTPAAADPPAI